MDIDYTVAALMFPAIPLMMTMYSNRFHTLSGLIRKLHDQLTVEKKTPPQLENQLHVLNNRTNLLKYTEIMLKNINDWKDAPIWTPKKINQATKKWFHYLGRK